MHAFGHLRRADPEQRRLFADAGGGMRRGPFAHVILRHELTRKFHRRGFRYGDQIILEIPQRLRDGRTILATTIGQTKVLRRIQAHAPTIERATQNIRRGLRRNDSCRCIQSGKNQRANDSADALCDLHFSSPMCIPGAGNPNRRFLIAFYSCPLAFANVVEYVAQRLLKKGMVDPEINLLALLFGEQHIRFAQDLQVMRYR